MGRIDYETETETVIVIVTSEVVSPTLMSGSTSPAAHGKKNGTDREALVAHLPVVAFNSNAQPDEMKFDEHVSAPLTCSQYSAVAIGFDILGTPASEVARATEVHTPLRARVPGQLENSTVTMVASGMRVRRLTPMECERLQGFPDRYTAIPKAKDGPRYKALGNSMAVPVMRWIGQQIDYAVIWSTP